MPDNESIGKEPITPASFQPMAAGVSETATRSSHRSKLLLGVGVVSFLLAALFLFNAQSIRIDVIAEAPAEISVGGFALPLGERYLVLPGTYSVEASADGYLPLVDEITVDQQGSQQFELVLQPLPGKLSVSSDPSGARVSIDGSYVGTTPLDNHRLPPGEHELSVDYPRYFDLYQTMSISGRGIHQQLDVQLSPAWAAVTVNSKPAGAAIVIDGETLGTTPQTLELLEGEHQLMLQLDSYADAIQTIVIEAGTPLTLPMIALQPAGGTLQLDSIPAGANVTLNGEFVGQTPLLLNLESGTEQQLAVLRPGFEPYRETLKVRPGSAQENKITLKARLGRIRVNVNPASAQVLVNGRPVGQGSQVLSLPAVAQQIEVQLAGHAKFSRVVTPRPGLEQLIDVQLLTEKAAKLARIKPVENTPLGQTMILFDPQSTGSAEFTMGASRRDPGRRSNEVLRPVALRRLFYLSATEVTNAEFRKFQTDHKSGVVKGKSLNRESQPVVNISWQQAASFCNWLSRQQGLAPFYKEDRGIVIGFNAASTGYRLPTEAEWAWAARIKNGEALRFPWGDNFPPVEAVENYADASSAFITGRVLNNYEDGHIVSAPVASYKKNHNQLHDIGGNVSEWIHDVYSISANDGSQPTDPLGAQSGDNHVIRGASWDQARLPHLRLSYRDYGQAGRDDVGFRIARYAE